MNNVSTPARRPFTIVVGASFTPESDYALDQAARMANRIPGSELHVVRAIAGTVRPARVEEIADRLEAYMNEVTAAIGVPVEHFAVHVRPGPPSRVIVQVAREVTADLIVLGAKESGLKNLFVGSVTKRTMSIAPCPVFVAGPKPLVSRVQSTTIEPACADCLAVRAETAGATWWCSQHGRQHPHAHAYRYRRELPLRQPDSLFEPAGATRG